MKWSFQLSTHSVEQNFKCFEDKLKILKTVIFLEKKSYLSCNAYKFFLDFPKS